MPAHHVLQNVSFINCSLSSLGFGDVGAFQGPMRLFMDRIYVDGAEKGAFFLDRNVISLVVNNSLFENCQTSNQGGSILIVSSFFISLKLFLTKIEFQNVYGLCVHHKQYICEWLGRNFSWRNCRKKCSRHSSDWMSFHQ